MDHKVLITTSGPGRLLGNLTKHTNAALLRVGKKPAISYIIEAYPKDTKFVITVGYFGDQVKDFLSLAYPERTFEFVEVDTYDGEGASLGHSMLQARKNLNCPFIFHALDTIVFGEIPIHEKNWIGVFRGEDAAQYASWEMGEDGKLRFKEKGSQDFDYIHIGLIGINNHESYWRKLEELYRKDPHNFALADAHPIVKMIEENEEFEIKEFASWHGVGTGAALARTRAAISDAFSNLDKVEEEIFLFDEFVIKFFANEKLLANRVARAKILAPLVPKILGVAKNFYKYEFIKGDLYSHVADPVDFKKFLAWAKEKLWLPSKEVDRVEFKKVCLSFYKDKTEERVKKFMEVNAIKDETTVINGEKIPPLSEVLGMIDWNWLSDAHPTHFHGDFILENIIKTKDGYSLIDWRQDFGGLLEAGDMYYDLAKLNHNLIVNHDIVHKDLFTIETTKDGDIKAEILVKSSLADCRLSLTDFLNKNGFDKKKVGVLSAVIWLNMSPLHHHPFNKFLFYFGKYNLWRALK